MCASGNDGGIVCGQACAARRIPDHAERAWRPEFRVNNPKLIRLARRGLRRDRSNREFQLVEIDRHREGG